MGVSSPDVRAGGKSGAPPLPEGAPVVRDAGADLAHELVGLLHRLEDLRLDAAVVVDAVRAVGRRLVERGRVVRAERCDAGTPGA